MADVIKTDGPVAVRKTSVRWGVGEGKYESAEGTFEAPSSVNTFKDWFDSLPEGEENASASFKKASPENGLQFSALGGLTKHLALEFMISGMETNLKQRMRPSPTIESPWLTRDDIKINLFDGQRVKKVKGGADVVMSPISLDKCLAAINTGLSNYGMTESQAPTYFEVAYRMHLEGGSAREKGGIIYTNKDDVGFKTLEVVKK